MRVDVEIFYDLIIKTLTFMSNRTRFDRNKKIEMFLDFFVKGAYKYYVLEPSQTLIPLCYH